VTFHPEISAKAHEMWDGDDGPKVKAGCVGVHVLEGAA
jgi:hypothetical protein